MHSTKLGVRSWTSASNGELLFPAGQLVCVVTSWERKVVAVAGVGGAAWPADTMLDIGPPAASTAVERHSGRLICNARRDAALCYAPHRHIPVRGHIMHCFTLRLQRVNGGLSVNVPCTYD